MSNYLSEAFKKLDILDEDIFEVDKDGLTALKDFEDSDDEEDTITVVDPDAEDEEELEDSYIGKVILDCSVCHTDIYKDKEDITIDDESGLANIGEECPYCYSSEGFKVIGEVKPFVEVEFDTDDDVEVKVDGEEVEKNESLRRSKRLRESSSKRNKRFKKLNESNDEIYRLKDVHINFYFDEDDYDWDEDEESGAADYYGYNPEEKAAEDTVKEWFPSAKYIDIVDTDDGDGFLVADIEGPIQIFNEYNELIMDDIETAIKDFIECNDLSLDEFKKIAINSGILDNDDFNGIDIEESLHEKKEDSIRYFPKLTAKENNFFHKKGDWDILGKENSIYDVNIIAYDRHGRDGKRKTKEIEDNDTEFLRKYGYTTEKSARNSVRSLADNFDIEIVKVDLNNKLKNDEEDEEYDESFSRKGLKESCSINQCQKWVDYDMKKYKKISDDTMKKIKSSGYSVVKDQYGDYEVIADRKNESCGKRKPRKMKESIEDITIDTGDQEITVSAKDKEEAKSDGEMIAPLSDEVKADIEMGSENDTVDVDVDEFSEEDFDELGESYLKKVYENVESYKTTSAKTKGNKLYIEGLIKFNSGKQKKTSFVFESKTITKTGKAKLIGENLQISRGHKSFKLTGTINNGKFISESLNYNYRVKSGDSSQRVYGTAKKSK